MIRRMFRENALAIGVVTLAYTAIGVTALLVIAVSGWN